MDIDARALLSGNQAIARGAWEGGVRVAAGYPGTPSTEILEALAALTADVGPYCEWSPNEKVALEVAVGASLAGGRALATMKHVGLNVAADPLFSAAYMGVNGGLVIVTADDPGMHSSQNEQDNRLFARAARLPLLEPSTPEEARLFTRRAFELSERFDTPVLLRSTTRLSHGTGLVGGDARVAPPLRPYRKDRVKNVVLPAHGRLRHRWIEDERMPALAAESEAWIRLDEGEEGDRSRFGIVTAGVPWLYASEAFPGVPVLKLGMTYPLPVEALLRFGRDRRVLVVEELEPFLEEQLRALGIECETRTWPRWGELSVEALLGNGRARRTRARTDPEVATDPHTRTASPHPLPTLPVRAPALCPGCSHRGVFHGLRRQGAVVAGDIGCYTLGALPPLDAMDACLCMGASIGMGHGFTRVRPDEGRPVVSVIGDSTFFHSGITGLMDVVYNGGSSTTVVTDNSTTAMTGHQDHPGTGTRLSGGPAPKVDIEALVRALGVEDVRRIDTYDLMGTWRALDEATKADHPSVILAEAPCVLKEKVSFHGSGPSGDGVSIDADACTDCLTCADIGCPALEQIDGHMRVNQLLCVDCTHCQQVCSDCNAGIDIPLILELVDRDRVEEALDVLLRSNPLPAVSARVCPHPCEREVNALGWPQGARRAADHPALVERFPSRAPDRISVRAVERWLGDQLLERPPERFAPTEHRNGSAAVIGSGPAGLSAAWTLRRAGWRVTVFEAAPEPGGMLRLGIPGFRLPREVLDGELARFRAIGVDVRCGVRVGEHVTLREIEEDFGAVILAVGNHLPRAMELEGAGAAGSAVLPGLAFLDRFNAGERLDLGRKVAVVGGGNTAVDCARAAMRTGAEAVVLYRRTEEEMPAIPEEVEEARTEGVRFVFQRQPVRVVAGPGGKLAGVETVAMRQGPPEADGRRRAEAVEGSESREDFDAVILAVGEEADLRLLEGCDIRHNGRISSNFAGVTSRPGVFACGDAAFGHGTVTQAIATGRRAAELASRHLARKELKR